MLLICWVKSYEIISFHIEMFQKQTKTPTPQRTENFKHDNEQKTIRASRFIALVTELNLNKKLKSLYLVCYNMEKLI